MPDLLELLETSIVKGVREDASYPQKIKQINDKLATDSEERALCQQLDSLLHKANGVRLVVLFKLISLGAQNDNHCSAKITALLFHSIFDGPDGPTVESYKTLAEDERMFLCWIWLHLLGDALPK